GLRAARLNDRINGQAEMFDCRRQGAMLYDHAIGQKTHCRRGTLHPIDYCQDTYERPCVLHHRHICRTSDPPLCRLRDFNSFYGRVAPATSPEVCLGQAANDTLREVWFHSGYAAVAPRTTAAGWSVSRLGCTRFLWARCPRQCTRSRDRVL